MTALYIILGLAVVVGLALVAFYNRFVKLRNMADEAWSGVDVQLKRRYDLIPNLVNTVKGYVAHERETLEKLIDARNRGMGAQSVADQAQAENMISGALKSLFALSEAYPDLKANQNFLQLQDNLNLIEDEIQKARRYYNAIVRDFNIACQSFPSVIVARMFGFTEREFFEIEEAARENVKVSF